MKTYPVLNRRAEPRKLKHIEKVGVAPGADRKWLTLDGLDAAPLCGAALSRASALLGAGGSGGGACACSVGLVVGGALRVSRGDASSCGGSDWLLERLLHPSEDAGELLCGGANSCPLLDKRPEIREAPM